MPLDPSISLNAKPTDPMTSLSSMLGAANAVNQYQAGQLGLQKAQALLQPEIEQGKAQSREAIANANVAEGTQQPKIAQANIAAHQAQWMLDKDQAQVGMQMAGGLLTDPDIQALADPKTANDPDALTRHSAAAMDKLSDMQATMENAGIPRSKVLAALSPLATAATHDPTKLPGMLRNITMAGIPAAGQGAAAAPSGVGIDTGQTISTVNTNPLAPQGIGQAIPGTIAQKQLPPTTPVIGPQGEKRYYGAQGRGGPQAELAPGVAENIGGTVGVVNKDWESTSNEASKATQDMALLENIKKFAPEAAAGNGANYWNAINGWLAGVSGGTLAKGDWKTAADLAEKNANILAGSGGNTDAARTLALAANPNLHMTQQAIQEAADQLISQRKMALAKQEYLGQYKNAPDAYKDHLTIWNKNADPRVLQFEAMNPQDQKAFVSKMPADQRASFRQKIQFFNSIGAIK